MMKTKLIVLIGMCLVGCSHLATKMNDVALGMSKKEVISELGSPNETKARDGFEVLEYDMVTKVMGTHERYWVVLHDNKVVQYGRAGDFDSFTPQKVDLTVHQR